MIDFGLVALIALMMVLLGCSGALFLSMRRELDSIKSVDSRIKAAEETATKALAAAEAFDRDQYKGLAKKVASCEEKADKLADDFLSLRHKFGALKRWSKEEESQASTQEEEAPELPMFPAMPPEPPQHLNGSRPEGFGKKRR